MNPYEELGISKDASDEEIKKAFRAKARRHHPDVGGDPEQFRKIAVCYDVLSDQDKRTRFDKGESLESITKAQTSEEGQIIQVIMIALDRVTQNTNPQYIDVLRDLKKQIQHGVDTFKAESKKLDKEIEKFNAILKRLKAPEGSLFVLGCNQKIQQFNAKKSEFDFQARIGEAALKRLEDHGYEVDKMKIEYDPFHSRMYGQFPPIILQDDE